jgi:hypothetical protein
VPEEGQSLTAQNFSLRNVIGIWRLEVCAGWRTCYDASLTNLRCSLRIRFASFSCARAQVAELADALASGASGLTVVEVRVLSWAPFLLLQNSLKDSRHAWQTPAKRRWSGLEAPYIARQAELSPHCSCPVSSLVGTKKMVLTPQPNESRKPPNERKSRRGS